MSEAEFTTGIPEGVRAIAGPIVCHHAADGNAEAYVVSHAGLQVFDGAGGFFVRMDLIEGDAGGVVHGDMDIFPADTAMERLALPASGDAMPGAPEAPELLDVDVDHVTGIWVLVAAGRFRRIKIPGPAEPCSAEDTTDSGRRDLASVGDLVSGQALTTQPDDCLDGRGGRRAMQPVRTRGTLPEAVGALSKEAVHPLADRLATDAEGLGDAASAFSFLDHAPDNLGSTMRCGAGILVDVHSVSFPGIEVSQPQSPRSGPNGQPIERSHLGADQPGSRFQFFQE